jgi:hypothetical protein
MAEFLAKRMGESTEVPPEFWFLDPSPAPKTAAASACQAIARQASARQAIARQASARQAIARLAIALKPGALNPLLACHPPP